MAFLDKSGKARVARGQVIAPGWDGKPSKHLYSFFFGGDFEVSQILGPSLVSSCLNRITYSLMSDVFFSHQLWVNPYLAYLGMFAELFNLVILDYHVLSLQFFFLGSGTWRCPTSLLTRITCTTCRKCRGATKKG